ncbi:MAG: OmpA family protein [Planctomycetota bacterium]|jgi:chemotaxis protein MotB|nr:OmpA family protein [Planctomycetota bacterium]
MAKKKKKGGGGPSLAEFSALTSFSDMMTLMLTFFVLLFTLSEPKKPRIQATMKAFMKQLGVLPFNTSPMRPMLTPQRTSQEEANILRRGPPGKRPETITIVEDNRQKIVIGGEDLFRPGSSELSVKGRRILQNDVAPDIKGFRNRIEVRGHTANTSDSSQDLWNLGYARSFSVMRYLVDTCGLDEHRFRLISCADNEPRDPLQPAQNRRVEIIMTEAQVSLPGGN